VEITAHQLLLNAPVTHPPARQRRNHSIAQGQRPGKIIHKKYFHALKGQNFLTAAGRLVA
jgi:hypothetical protein